MTRRSVRFEIPGEPCAKGRPRFVRATGRAITPEKTVRYEQLVQLTYMQLVGQEVILDGPLQAEIDAYFAIPKSASKKRRGQMAMDIDRPMKKPDADNLAKSVLDALNGVAYRDDKEVVSLTVRKHWASSPHVTVTLREL